MPADLVKPSGLVAGSPWKVRGRPEHSADRIADAVLLAWPEVPVHVERHPGRLVAQCQLDLLDTAPGVDERAGEEVAQIVEADRPWDPGPFAGHADVVTELRRVHRLVRIVDDHPVGACAERGQVRGHTLEDPIVGRYQPSARLGLGRSEGARPGAARLLPLSIDRDDPTQKVDPIDGEPGRL